MKETYSDQFCDWLTDQGYTHCFFVAGGNIMHLLNSARSRFTCIPVVHEVAAGIAVEYFNETSPDSKAFALVTAGPGVTNIVTAIAGAWLESRELLVIGGQVKSSDLASPQLRQRGIQELNGVALVESITKQTLQIQRPKLESKILEICDVSKKGRPGPVFIEFCLDAQGAPSDLALNDVEGNPSKIVSIPTDDEIRQVESLISKSLRPVLLIGGGVSREKMARLLPHLESLNMPIMTTWNALDRIDSSHPLYWGRPNTWGQRSANVLLQQSDLIIAVGTRLGIQQTGFNWNGFAPLATIVHVDIDMPELAKGHPNIDLAICADAYEVLNRIDVEEVGGESSRWKDWKKFGLEVRELLPTNESANSRKREFLNPYDFVEAISEVLDSEDIVIPCSSGGAFTTVMQAFQQKYGQKVVTNKGLASMGYGLSGAIGAAYANPGKRVVLIEGDGGFAQNIQEIGTVVAGHLPLKVFIYDNAGYASIRMTQANYFGGEYVGCDRETGLGLPNWESLFASYGIKTHSIDPSNPFEDSVLESMVSSVPVAFILPIDPEQTYFPKITSRVLANGSMESNPLHLMTPELSADVTKKVFRYLNV
ncbi:MAG: thiamine pyrophosphate-binding protein [Candidatus Nanopelagicaceae bacterium]|nr:thiamine pyrophosphate-binding protein [Candidatus Nanopelagicaceae bacterium]